MLQQKYKVDGSNNSLFINHNFLLGIYKERLTETISLKEHQDTLLVFNNRIGLLAGNIIKLYTKVNFYEDTKKPNYITQRELLENDIKYSIKNIKDLYSDLIKEELRRKNFETAIDIQDFCISILNKTEYLLKDRFFISIEESPLKDSYKEISIELKEAIDIDKIKLLNEIKKETTKTEIETIDLSDSTATEKIIYLHKLGVIDFLRTKQPFNASTNSLATILSAVTGAKSGTIQPMLNAMLSKDVEQKNNPLKSQKPVKKVNQQLIHIGFNLDKTI